MNTYCLIHKELLMTNAFEVYAICTLTLPQLLLNTKLISIKFLNTWNLLDLTLFLINLLQQLFHLSYSKSLSEHTMEQVLSISINEFWILNEISEFQFLIFNFWIPIDEFCFSIFSIFPLKFIFWNWNSEIILKFLETKSEFQIYHFIPIK